MPAVRSKAQDVDNAGSACVWCDYDLQGLPECGSCPECGRDYDPQCACFRASSDGPALLFLWIVLLLWSLSPGGTFHSLIGGSSTIVSVGIIILVGVSIVNMFAAIPRSIRMMRRGQRLSVGRHKLGLELDQASFYLDWKDVAHVKVKRELGCMTFLEIKRVGKPAFAIRRVPRGHRDRVECCKLIRRRLRSERRQADL